jgi:hypothetical protein
MPYYGLNPYSRFTDDEDYLKSPINNYPKTTYPDPYQDDDSVINPPIICVKGNSVNHIERFWSVRKPVFFVLIVISELTKICKKLLQATKTRR